MHRYTSLYNPSGPGLPVHLDNYIAVFLNISTQECIKNIYNKKKVLYMSVCMYILLMNAHIGFSNKLLFLSLYIKTK